MAAPQVAGVAALMKAIHPDLAPEELDLLLANGSITDDIGPAGRDEQFGSGLINAFKALDAARILAGGGILPLTLIVNPPALNFGPQSTADLRIEQGGGTPEDQLVVDAVSADVPWLTVTAVDIDANRLGTYLVDLKAQHTAQFQNGLTIHMEFALFEI